MRQWSVRNGFDFLNVQDSKVRLPLMKSIERIVIRTEIFPKACTSNRLLEHPTESLAVDNSWVDSKSDDPTRVLVHDDQHPIRSQCDRFAAKQIEAPQTVLHVAEER